MYIKRANFVKRFAANVAHDFRVLVRLLVANQRALTAKHFIAPIARVLRLHVVVAVRFHVPQVRVFILVDFTARFAVERASRRRMHFVVVALIIGIENETPGAQVAFLLEAIVSA